MGMNANEKLYEQGLFYSSTEGPYQCLAVPWWVQTTYPTYYPRHNCELQPLHCGANVFRQISEDLKQAKHSVDIVTWGFDPGMVLRRGANAYKGQRYGDLLKEIATRKENPVVVRLLVWHDDAAAEWMMKNIPGYYGTRFPAVGCALSGYYDQTHQSYNAEWFDEVRGGKFPNISFHVRSVAMDRFSEAIKGEHIPLHPAAHVSARFPAHHQKMLLIDYEHPRERLAT